MRLLVVDAYDPLGRAALDSCGATRAGRLYRAAIASIDAAESLGLDLLEMGASDPGVETAVGGYDGIVWTGSNLTIHRPTDLVLEQLELSRSAFAAGVPQFGSCWAIHLAVVAAGGTCARNPKGREFGVARSIRPNAAGRHHPLLAGRSPRYEAFASHEDVVVSLPPGATSLAGNEFCRVQAAEVRFSEGVFWAVQYHPEYDFHELASLSVMRREQLVREGRFTDEAGAVRYAEDCEALQRGSTDQELLRRQDVGDGIIDPDQRRLEIRNWLDAIRHGTCR